jgi:thioredoxin reductase
LPFEKRLFAALREQASDKAAARVQKEKNALEMRAQIPLVFAAGDGDFAEVQRLIAAGHGGVVQVAFT